MSLHDHLSSREGLVEVSMGVGENASGKYI
jgi:hypothetical protein